MTSVRLEWTYGVFALLNSLFCGINLCFEKLKLPFVFALFS